MQGFLGDVADLKTIVSSDELDNRIDEQNRS